jgi:hypothetical protein
MKLGSLALIKRGTARSGDRVQTAEGVVAVTFEGRITQPKRMTTQMQSTVGLTARCGGLARFRRLHRVGLFWQNRT